MTRWYWSQVGGTLVEEFCAVSRSAGCGHRLIDGIIIQDGEHRIAKASEVQIADRHITVVQTKAERLGMYLMGQAFFSAHLMKRFQPRSITSVALCHQSDEVLAPIFESYPNMKVVVCPEELPVDPTNNTV
jgi:hypothetical protein